MRRLSSLLMACGIGGSIFLASWIQARYRSKVPLFDLVEVRWLSIYGLTMFAALAILGLPGPFSSFGGAAKATGGGVLLTTALFSLISQIFGPWLLPRPVVLVFAPVLCFCVAILCAALFSNAWNRTAESVVFLGTAENEERLLRELSRGGIQPATLVGSVDVSGPGATSRFTQTAATLGPSLVVLDELAQADADLVRAVSDYHVGGARVRTLTGFYDEWLGKLPVSELVRMHLLFDVGHLHGSSYRRTKRTIDFAVGLVGAAIVLVAIPVVVVGNLFGNRGRTFFSQMRVGEGGKEFSILKFRTMRPTKEAAGKWTQEGDVRITRFGKVLRKTHLDELPQAINLIRGDISLVGPRPEQTHYVEMLSQKLPHYEYRHSVKPGITGWAQIRYAYGANEDDALEKLEYELFYLAHQSTILDLKIIARTFSHFLFGQGR